MTPMLERRCRLGVAALNGKLYAAGGYSGSFFLKRFETTFHNNKMTRSICVFEFAEYFHIISVEEYDPVTDKWRYIASMNVSRSRVALCANMGKLWAVGGNNNDQEIKLTIEMKILNFIMIIILCF